MTKVVAVDVVEFNGVRVTVSTINRQSSALGAYGDSYAETLVFGSPDSPTPGKILAQGEAPEGSRITHDKFVARYKETGSFEEVSDD